MAESAKYKNTMRDEYNMRRGVCRKYAKRFPRDVVMVLLDPGVPVAFTDAESLNEALRVSAQGRQESRSGRLNSSLEQHCVSE